MSRLLLSLAVVASAATGPQAIPQRVTVASVQWGDMVDRRGNHQTVPLLSLPDSAPQNPQNVVLLTFPPEFGTVATLDEEFRLAKLGHDTQTLAGILSDDFFGTNQNGNSRNKAEFLTLFEQFPITSLTTNTATIRSAGNIVIMAGTQTEVNMTGTDRMLFTRVYRNEGANEWKLLSSTQFRVP